MKLDNDIHNYYEHLVLETLDKTKECKGKSDDYIADLVCLVLNQLPPRYIRFEVDMAFYLPNSERLQMQMNVEKAITQGLEYLESANRK
ncbi:late competence development ComFB family protein [Agaribacter flavus]|uniref:Late competence development ComFB family protein n=1 Tax=Agaribacter flavus TaxID=1902781 RepID=A0ABV7FM67_9ALTE